MLITLSPTSTTTLGRYPFHYMYVLVCVVVFMSFHQPFHRINDASKPRTVSSKQELFPKKKKKRNVFKNKNCLIKDQTNNCFVKPKTVSSKRKLSQNKPSTVSKKQQLFHQKENCLNK